MDLKTLIQADATSVALRKGFQDGFHQVPVEDSDNDRMPDSLQSPLAET